MSELLDKQVIGQKEYLKNYFRGSRELPQAHEKSVMKMKVERKNNGCLKYFCGQEGVYKTRVESSCNGYQSS